MDAERVLEHQTVLVRGDTIVRIAPAVEVSIPLDALRIEGHGTAYVLPGLADMHTHIEAVEDAALYLANGITTVVQMGSGRIFPVRRIRAGIADGTILAPQIFFALMVDDALGCSAQERRAIHYGSCDLGTRRAAHVHRGHALRQSHR